MENTPNQNPISSTPTPLPPSSDPVAGNLHQTNLPQQPVKNTNYWKVTTIFLLILILLFGIALTYLMTNKPKTQTVLVQQTPTIQPGSSPIPLTNATPVNPITNWKTYTNIKHNYSIKYPDTWSFREFPDTKDGAGFYDTAAGDVVGGEPITINFSARPTDKQNVPFADYVKIAAAQEIQNFQSLSTIDPITTTSGIVGYKTTWKVASMTNAQNISDSLPITYFDSKSPTGETVQVSLGDQSDQGIYTQMLSTFQFTNQLSTSDQQAVTTLVKNFYSSLANQDGKTLFSYMTPALSVDEESNYSWLTGADLAPDTYRVFLRVKISNPQIESIQKVDNATYQVSINDQIQSYSNAAPIGWSKPTTRNKIVMTVVNVNGKWLVDKFTDQSNTSNSGNAATPKYNGFGQ